jgi:hypothetical protein
MALHKFQYAFSQVGEATRDREDEKKKRRSSYESRKDLGMDLSSDLGLCCGMGAGYAHS